MSSTSVATSSQGRSSAAPKQSSNGHSSDDQSGEYNSSSRAPLDVMLADATTSSFRRWAPGPEAIQWVSALARHPSRPARRLLGLGKELGKITLGRSEVAPSKKDKRFADAAWTSNPLFMRACQAYLAAVDTAEGLVADAELDWR